jgi:ribosomal protein L40E
MSTVDRSSDHTEKQFASVCGLFCPSCTLYIASSDDPERLTKIAGMLGLPEEEARCLGCSSDVQGPTCRNCKLVACAVERGVEFCAHCTDYPCEELREFQAAMPHRADLFEDGQRIREAGFEKWFRETFDKYTCRQCQTINSAYDLACRKCGHEPGSSFSDRHREVIEKHPLAVALEREVDK